MKQKIKIAAWLMMVIGILSLFLLIGVLILAFVYGMAARYSVAQIIIGLLLGGPFIVALLYVLCSYFLIKGKKWAWYASIVLLLKDAVAVIKSLLQFLFSFSEKITLFKEMQTIAPPQALLFYIISLIFFITIGIMVFLSLVLLLNERENYFYKKL